MTKLPALLALPLLLAFPLAALPASSAGPCGDVDQCSAQECEAATVAGPDGITCAVSEPVWCEHPWLEVDHCQVWQICSIEGTGVVGCASGDGEQDTCIAEGAPGDCLAIHFFTVGPGAGPFFNVCSTFGTGSVSPVTLPTATVAKRVSMICTVSITFNT